MTYYAMSKVTKLLSDCSNFVDIKGGNQTVIQYTGAGVDGLVKPLFVFQA